MFPLAYTPPAPGAAGAAAVATDAAGASDPALPAPYECPITHLRCDKHAFVALRPCGHLFAERAVREAAGDGSCPTCGKPFLPEDAIPLLPSEERLEQLRDLLPTRRKQQQQGGERGKKRRQAEAATQQQQGGAAEQGAARAGAATAGSGQQQQQQSGD